MTASVFALSPSPASAIVTPTFQVTSRVSVSSTGAQQAAGFTPSITPDGRYVLFSMAAPSISGAGSKTNVFRRDQWTGDVVLVSAARTAGTVPNGDSGEGSMSDDGKWIVFESTATNLVAGDTNGHKDVFLRNMDAKSTQAISVSSAEAAGDGDSSDASISGAGDRVAFSSKATNLVTGDTNGAIDVFVRSWIQGTTQRASVTSAAAQATGGDSSLPEISGDGNNVAFVSGATNLVAGDTNATFDVFVRSIPGASTTRVSIKGATQGDGQSGSPSISNDGSYIAFQSSATNLVTGDSNGHSDTFRWTRSSKLIERVSVNAFGGQIALGSYLGNAISRDGNVVVWTSKGDDVTLPAGDGSDVHVYTRNLTTDFTKLIDTRPNGQPGTDNFTLGMATDQTGRRVAYSSTSPDLVRHDTNADYDAFVTDTALTIGPFSSISNFVTQQFQDFVGRAPSAAELAEGIAVITNGELSPERYIIAKALGSPFATERAPVMRLYWAFFLREPDLGGFDYWVTKKENGATLNAIAQKFAQSSEFKTHYGSLSNTAFVKLVYFNVLDRQPDAAGLAHWVAKLDTGALTRGAVMVQFSESSEGVRVIAPETDAVLLSLGMLRRLPTTAEFNSWRTAIGNPAIPYKLANPLFTGAQYGSRFP